MKNKTAWGRSMAALLLLFITSCNGQNAEVSHRQSSAITIGNTVKELGDSVWIIFQDKNNNYWFGSNGQGVFRYDGKTIVRFTTKDGLTNDSIRQIQEDKSGNIYFTTVKGISKFDARLNDAVGQGKTFTTLSITNSNKWKLEPDDLWFTGAQDSGVVYRYDGKHLHRLEFPETKEGDEHFARIPRSKFPNAKYSPYDVYIIYKDSKGNIWFGTTTLGVCRYDGKSFTWLSEKELEFDEETGFGIRSVLEDKDGKFWFSNTLHRYIFYEEASAIKYKKEKGPGSLDGKKDGDLVAIMSMVKDNAGEIWMVTYNAGVWRYDGKNITHFPVKDGNKNITLFSIYKDNHGDLWLGTHENGVYKFNGKIFERQNL